MLMRTDPFREFDRLTDRFFGTAARPAAMPMDAYQDGDRFMVHFDLPGVDPASIDLTVENDVLTVTAERSWQAGEGQQAIISERPQGKFSRQLFLGENLESEQIEAHYDKGVLTLMIPVAEQSKARKIEITTGKSAAIEANSTAA